MEAEGLISLAGDWYRRILLALHSRLGADVFLQEAPDVGGRDLV